MVVGYFDSFFDTIGIVARTSDQGVTWSSILIYETKLRDVDTKYWDVSSVSTSFAVTAGDKGYIATSTDGGASWTAQATGYATTSKLSLQGVSLSSSYAYVCGYSTLSGDK